jgi:Holliday junction resolvasome RuvABC DNA-binding subunit
MAAAGGGYLVRNQLYGPAAALGQKAREDAEQEYWRQYGVQSDLYRQQNTNQAQGIINTNQTAQALEALSQLGYSLGSDTYQQSLANLRTAGDVGQAKVGNVRYMNSLKENLAALGYSRTREENNMEEEIARIRQQQAQSWEPGIGARMQRLLGYPA